MASTPSMRPPTTSIVPLYLAVEPRDIAVVKFVFEAYEGVGIVRTLNPEQAVVVVLVVPDMLDVADRIVEYLSAEYGVRRVPAPPEAADDWILRDESAEGGSTPS